MTAPHPGQRGGDRQHGIQYFRAELLISFVESIVTNILLLSAGRGVCVLFGSGPETLKFTLETIPKFVWSFSVMALNTMISTYLYSTKRSKHAITINVLVPTAAAYIGCCFPAKT